MRKNGGKSDSMKMYKHRKKRSSENDFIYSLNYLPTQNILFY